jgi:hypothetical protein
MGVDDLAHILRISMTRAYSKRECRIDFRPAIYAFMISVKVILRE